MHWDAISQFEEGGGRAGVLQEAMELFNIGGYEKVVVGWGDGAIGLNRFMAGESKYDPGAYRSLTGIGTRGVVPGE